MFDSEILALVGPALVAGLMIALTHAPLGIEVVRRGIIFIDLAIAQIAGLGMIVAAIIFEEPSAVLVQFVALTLAVLAGLFFHKMESVARDNLEAIIGVSFVLAASMVLLVLANSTHGGEDLTHLLGGQVLFVTWQHVLSHSLIYVFILTLWFSFPKVRTGIAFYLIFALALTSSVQLVGVYLVFSSLILPALAAYNTARPHLVAWACGVLSVLTGMLVSIAIDYPSGPVMVVSFVLMTVLFVSGRKLLLSSSIT